MFHLDKLKDLEYAHEYAVTILNRYSELSTFEDPAELWDKLLRETLQAAVESNGEHPSSSYGSVSGKIHTNIEVSRAARFDENLDLNWVLSRSTRTLLRRDKEIYDRNLSEETKEQF